MAFTTEFVMGAGGAGVEEIPVSMSGSGTTTYPLTTVDAGAGAYVLVAGTMSTGGNVNTRPHLHIGASTHTYPEGAFAGPAWMVGVHATGSVQVAVETRSGVVAASFAGTVYVFRL